MRIQNNVTAMNTHRMYTLNNDAVAASAKKLSSGYRINSAADDAAGLAISEKMRSQIRGLNMATKNSQDAISLVQTAEGALQETQNMLQRMNELAVQAATGTNETLDRNALAKEFEQLKREINDIAEQTNFNNMKILDGSLSYEGLKRSAATSGIYTSTENMTAGTTAMTAAGSTPGSDYAPSTKAAGANVSFDSTALSAAAEDGSTYRFTVEMGGDLGQMSIKGTATAQDVSDDKTIADVLAGGQATDGQGNVYEVSTTENGGLKLTRTDTDEVVELAEGITGTLATQVGDPAELTAGDPVKATSAHDAGWALGDDIFKQKVEVGQTYTVNFNVGTKNVAVSVEAQKTDGGITVGELLARSGKTVTGLDADGSGVGAAAGDTYKMTWDADTEKLHLENQSAKTVKPTEDLKATVYQGKDMASAIDNTGGSANFTPGWTDGNSTAGPATMNLDLSEAPEKDKVYTLTFAYIDQTGEQKFAKMVSEKAKTTDESIGALFGGKSVTIDGQVMSVKAMGVDSVKGQIAFEAGSDDTTTVTGLQILMTVGDAAAPDPTAGAAADKVEQVTEATNTTVALTGNDLDKKSNEGESYELTFEADGKSQSITVTGDGETKIGELIAGLNKGVTSINEKDYSVTYDGASKKLTFEATDASNRFAPALTNASLTTSTDSDPIEGVGVDGTVDSKGSEFALATKSYSVNPDALKLGDSIKIGDVTYTVAEKTDEAGPVDGKMNIAKQDFMETLKAQVNANNDDLTMSLDKKEVEDADAEGGKKEVVTGFTLEEKANKVATGGVEDRDDAEWGKGLERTGADLTATFKTNATTVKTTVEIDAVKLKAGDVVSVKVGDTDYKYTVQDGDNADKVIKGMVSDGGTKLVDSNEATQKGNAIIVEGQKVDVSGFVPRQENENAYNAVRIQVGALEGEQLSISIDAMNTKGLGLDDTHLMDPKNTEGLATLDQDAAGRAITATRDAINKISDQRATLGAMQNRLDHKIANLKISSENLTASESRIRDVDMAEEMTNFTKNNILSQAATAMLAQANSLPQNVLSLLG